MLVGAARFELAAPCTPCRCATGLRHAPTFASIAYQACGPQGGPSGTIANEQVVLPYDTFSQVGGYRKVENGVYTEHFPQRGGTTEQSEEVVVFLLSGHLNAYPFHLHGAHKGEPRLVTTTAKVCFLSSARVFHWGRPSFGSWKSGSKNNSSRLGSVSRGHLSKCHKNGDQ